MVDLYVNILIFFISASAILYVALGGADFGAGILEWIVPKELKEAQQNVINKAMGPVWEANHMWLIILVVILFMGFPKAFHVIVVSLHFPLVALLVGIVLRGCAFTFRHYDAVKDETSQKAYSFFFSLSSVWSSIWLGVIAASLTRGLLHAKGQDPYEIYLEPWFGLFPFLMGLFTLTIFTFLACSYLIGETRDERLKSYYQKLVPILNIGVVLLGGLVFLSSYLEPTQFMNSFFTSPFSLACLFLASVLFYFIWFYFKYFSFWMVRVVAAAQVSLILMGWFFVHWPNLIETKEGGLSFYEAAAPEPTLKQLVLALVIGSFFIFPSLFYLLNIFKSKQA